MMMVRSGFILHARHWQEMISHLERCLPEEACGLVAGQDGSSEIVYLIPNQLHSPTRFCMDPREQLNAFLDLEKRGYNLLAIFHSHPEGPDAPSETDLEEFAYPGVLEIICFRKGSDWRARAFLIEGGQASEIALSLQG